MDGRGKAPDEAPLEHRPGLAEKLVRGHGAILRQSIKRPRLQGNIALQDADGLDLCRSDRLMPTVALCLIRFAAVLELFEGRKRANDLALGFITENLDGSLQPELGVRRDRDGEPKIEVVVPPIVLGDPWIRVHGGCRLVHPFGVDARGHQAGAIAERAGIEQQGDLANHSVALEALGSFENLFFRHVDPLADHGERSRNDRDFSLQGAQQITVPLIDFLHLRSSVTRGFCCGQWVARL